MAKLKLGKALQIINHEAKAIDVAINYLKEMLDQKKPSENYQLCTVDVIIERYCNFSVNAEKSWSYTETWDFTLDGLVIAFELPVEPTEYFSFIKNAEVKLGLIKKLKTVKKKYYTLKVNVLSISNPTILCKQIVNGIPMVLLELDGVQFHDFFKNHNDLQNIPIKKYKKPDYTKVKAAKEKDISDALDVLNTFILSQKRGE